MGDSRQSAVRALRTWHCVPYRWHAKPVQHGRLPDAVSANWPGRVSAPVYWLEQCNRRPPVLVRRTPPPHTHTHPAPLHSGVWCYPRAWRSHYFFGVLDPARPNMIDEKGRGQHLILTDGTVGKCYYNPQPYGVWLSRRSNAVSCARCVMQHTGSAQARWSTSDSANTLVYSSTCPWGT